MRRPGGFAYGPVPSRRLGASLGVDVVPMKSCTYDCIYCQLGPTTTLTCERAPFYRVDEIVADVEEKLSARRPPRIITVAGCGEPTLYAGLGELIGALKGITRIPVALLTNGALFHRREVRREAARADLVMPSLDAGDEAMFRCVNRPADGLALEQVVEGLATFRREYPGEIWLEVMVLAGLTDTPSAVAAIAALARRIAPDRIQLNTAVRPTFEESAAPVASQRLFELSRVFAQEAEVVAGWRGGPDDTRAGGSPDDEPILRLLTRRPCTVEQIASGLGFRPNAVVKVLADLEHRGRAHRVVRGGRVFWHAIERRDALRGDA